MKTYDQELVRTKNIGADVFELSFDLALIRLNESLFIVLALLFDRRNHSPRCSSGTDDLRTDENISNHRKKYSPQESRRKISRQISI